MGHAVVTTLLCFLQPDIFPPTLPVIIPT